MLLSDASIKVVSLYQVVEEVRKLSENLIIVPGTDDLSTEAQSNATLLFNCLLRMSLSSKRICQEYRLSQAAFDYLIGEIQSRYARYYF